MPSTKARGSRVLFLLDEIARLGYIGILETPVIPAASTASTSASSTSRSPSSPRAGHRKAARPGSMPPICGSSPIFRITTRRIFSPRPAANLRAGRLDQRRLRLILKLEHNSRSTHRSTSHQQLARRLIKPQKVLQSLRYDEQIVLVQNAPPLRCGRAIYFRRPEMLARIKSVADRP